MLHSFQTPHLPVARRGLAHDPELEGLTLDESSTSERRLARFVWEYQGSQERLLALLASLPRAQRLMARVVFVRELGGVRAAGLLDRAYGQEWREHMIETGGPTPAPVPAATSSAARYDFARVRGLADVLEAATRRHPRIDGAVIEQALLSGDSHVALGAIALLLPQTERSTRPNGPGPVFGSKSHSAVGAPMTSRSARAHGGAEPSAEGRGLALLGAAERRAVTLYRRDDASGRSPDGDDPAVEAALGQLGGGESLAPEIRRAMERRFGVDLGRVRVHTDRVANEAALAVAARAFTVGDDIFFASGAYQPTAVDGEALLAHEITHVKQAYQGRIPGATTGHRVSRPEHPLEREAEAHEEAVRSSTQPVGSVESSSPRALVGAPGGAPAIDLDSRTPKALWRRPEPKQAGAPAGSAAAQAVPVTAMTFNGRTLTLEGQETLKISAISGKRANNHKTPDHKDHTGPGSQDMPDDGPIRAGSYSVNPADVEHSGFNKQVWGPTRVRIQESLLTSVARKIMTKREGGFFIHQDLQRDGTAGCIGIQSAPDVKKVFARIEQTKAKIPLKVEYPTNVSIELKDAPAGNTAEERVSEWLVQHKALIVAAESKWHVDRRAIAGAIAWEALNNIWNHDLPGARFSGPGKVHYKENHFSEGHPVSKEVEERGMLPSQTVDGRKDKVATPEGSIAYIGAIMRAYADEGRVAGYSLYREPALLATFFNGVKAAPNLEAAKTFFASKRAPEPLTVNPKMGAWVQSHLAWLEKAVGTPPRKLEPPPDPAHDKRAGGGHGRAAPAPSPGH